MRNYSCLISYARSYSVDAQKGWEKKLFELNPPTSELDLVKADRWPFLFPALCVNVESKRVAVD